MCLEGASILVLPCTILIALVAITLALLIEADRQGVEIPAVTPWVGSPLRHGSERLGRLLHSPSDEERIVSLLEFLDSAPLCSAVPVDEIDSCAEWAGCMLASGMDNTDGQNTARVDYVQAIRKSPLWQQLTWKVNLCGKEFTAAQDTWTVSALPLHEVPAEQTAVEYPRVSDDELQDRTSTIKEACVRAWRAYQKLAWGSDELLPVSRIGHRYRGDGLGMFIVDAMETLHILGEQEAFDYAVAWVAGNSSGMPGAFDQAMNIDANSGTWPTAEVVPHIVGGLLSSYQLSGYDTLIDAADRVAGRLESAFQTHSGLPLQQCDLSHGVCHRPEGYPHNPRGDATVEETWAAGLELAILAHVSHRVEHWRHGLEQKVATASRRMLEAIDKRAANARLRLGSDNDAADSLVRTHGAYARLMMQTEDTAAAYGLPGSLIDPDSGEWVSDARHTVAYGARHGSSAERYYSGLLHQYIWWSAVASKLTNSEATNGRTGVTREEATLLAQQCKKWYLSAIEGLRRLLVRRSTGKHKLWYIGELVQGRQFLPAFSSTSCGLSGTLALGHINGIDDDGSHLKLAQRLAESCVRISQLTASGLPPDVTWLNGRPKAHEDAVEWFVSDEDSQQLHAVRTDRPGEHASRMDSTETVSHLRESAEVVVVRDQHGSSSCTGGPALAQSLYWLYRATKHPKYVEWAWGHYQALEQSSRLPREDSGYASVFDVTNSSSSHRDEMKGWLLTTFKWVWLLQREAGKSDAESEMSALLPRDAIPSTVGHVLLTTWS